MEHSLGKCVAWTIGCRVVRERDGVKDLGGCLDHILEIILIDVEYGGGDLVNREASITEFRIVESRKLELEFGSCENVS